ncbi:MAG TPA: hypothetical protein VGD26_10435 [Chitinophagaceae bacterium]
MAYHPTNEMTVPSKADGFNNGTQIAFEAISANIDRLVKAWSIHQERLANVLRPADYPTEARDDKAYGPYSRLALDFLSLAERLNILAESMELTTDRIDV